MQGRALWATQQGRFATGSYLKEGDIVCVLHGCSSPVALREVKLDVWNATWRACKSAVRRSADTSHGVPSTAYRVLGTCYLEGWMDPWSSGKVDWNEDDADHFVLI